MTWAGHATCRRQITNACSILGRKTLVGIVGFRRGMKHKTFRECCTQHHSMATCQPYNHLRNIIPFLTSLAGLFAHYAFTPFPSYSKCTLLPSNLTPAATIHSINSRAASILRRCLGPHEGSSERGFGCGQQIKASLASGSAQFERQSLRHSGVSKLSHGLTRFLFMNWLQNATLAPSSSRLFLPLFVFLTSCRILFEKLVVAHLVTTFPFLLHLTLQ